MKYSVSLWHAWKKCQTHSEYDLFFFRGSSTQLARSYSVAHSPIPDVPEESSHFALGSSYSKMLIFEFKISGVSYHFFFCFKFKQIYFSKLGLTLKTLIIYSNEVDFPFYFEEAKFIIVSVAIHQGGMLSLC